MDELDAFLALSAVLGCDPLQVQGAGGNTSIKDNGDVLVKASGTWLKDAQRSDIFVSVNIEQALRALDGDDEPDLGALAKGGLRPSIETTFHALLPHKVVLHTHSVATIAHATSDDGIAQLSAKLGGLDWHLVPYAKPGTALARSMAGLAVTRTPVVIILANHGLIAAAGSVAEAGELIGEVERRLRMPPTWQADGAKDINCPDGWTCLAEYASLATDEMCLRRASDGSYYPDHVVFLGHALPVLDSPDQVVSLARERPAAIVAKQAVLVRDDAKPAAVAMLGCLHDVLCRQPRDWNLNALTEEQEAELLDWDAEKYRQAIRRGN